jgi:hypothetical protein
MMTIYDRQIEELTAEYRRRRAQAGELRRKIGEISGCATAPREVVKVTVGAQGEVRAVEFPTGAYKRMAPAELAGTLMATIGEARDKALAAVGELMTPELPRGLNIVDLLQGKADLPGALPAEPAIPDAVREYVDHGRGQRDDGGRDG